MSEEPTTLSGVELTRRAYEGFSRRDRDLDAVMRDYDDDSVFDLSPAGMGSFRGVAAIRGFLEDWIAAYEEYEIEPEDLLDIGNGVVFAVICQNARPAHSTGNVRFHHGNVFVWEEGVIARVIDYNDIDEARAAAERLAEERGWAMSENLDLVRSIYADWERGDFSRGDWADPKIEFVIAEGLEPGSWTGVSAWMEWRDDFLSAWEGYSVKAVEYRELDDERVLVLSTAHGRGRASGLELRGRGEGAVLFHVRDGKVTRQVNYLERDRALADLGLEE